MFNSNKARSLEDPHDLIRFVDAHQGVYERALAEIRGGRKRTHWMWYIFPQIDGLGFSSTSRRYSIKSVEEAKAYLNHPILGPRLLDCIQAVVRIEGRSATDIFGYPRRFETKVVCDPVRECVACGLSIRTRPRQILSGWN